MPVRVKPEEGAKGDAQVIRAEDARVGMSVMQRENGANGPVERKIVGVVRFSNEREMVDYTRPPAKPTEEFPNPPQPIKLHVTECVQLLLDDGVSEHTGKPRAPIRQVIPARLPLQLYEAA